MDTQKINIATATVELSEYSTYILLRNEMCFYNEPNRNGVGLRYDERSYDRALTLIDMPVYAKYIKRMGKDDLGGHENHIDSRTGEMIFDTEAIGVHTSIEISSKNTDVNGVVKCVPCLYATLKIWKRNKNVVNAIKRLYTLGKLTSSYEIRSYSCEEQDNVRWLTDYEFEGNALLGSGHIPAYTNSNIEMLCASQDKDLEMLIAEALTDDLKGKEGANMDNKETKNQAEIDEMKDVDTISEANEGESKTEESKQKDIETDEATSNAEETNESKTNKINSDIDEDSTTNNDNATCKDDKDEIKKLQNALSEATQIIASLTSEVESMKGIVDKYNAIMAERVEAEKAKTRSELKSYAEKSGLFNSEEFENPESEIAKIIAEADKDGIKRIISDRYIESLSQKENKDEVITSETESKARIDVASKELMFDKVTGKELINTYIKTKSRK